MENLHIKKLDMRTSCKAMVLFECDEDDFFRIKQLIRVQL